MSFNRIYWILFFSSFALVVRIADADAQSEQITPTEAAKQLEIFGQHFVEVHRMERELLRAMELNTTIEELESFHSTVKALAADYVFRYHPELMNEASDNLIIARATRFSTNIYIPVLRFRGLKLLHEMCGNDKSEDSTDGGNAGGADSPSAATLPKRFDCSDWSEESWERFVKAWLKHIEENQNAASVQRALQKDGAVDVDSDGSDGSGGGGLLAASPSDSFRLEDATLDQHRQALEEMTALLRKELPETFNLKGIVSKWAEDVKRWPTGVDGPPSTTATAQVGVAVNLWKKHVPNCPFYVFSRLHVYKAAQKQGESGSGGTSLKEDEIVYNAEADEARCEYKREQLIEFLKANDPSQAYIQAMSNALNNVQRTKGQLKAKIVEIFRKPEIKEELKNIREQIEDYFTEKELEAMQNDDKAKSSLDDANNENIPERDEL